MLVCNQLDGYDRPPQCRNTGVANLQGFDHAVKLCTAHTCICRSRASVLVDQRWCLSGMPWHAGLHATSVHPGGIYTPLAKFLDPAVMQAMITPEVEGCPHSP